MTLSPSEEMPYRPVVVDGGIRPATHGVDASTQTEGEFAPHSGSTGIPGNGNPAAPVGHDAQDVTPSHGLLYPSLADGPLADGSAEHGAAPLPYETANLSPSQELPYSPLVLDGSDGGMMIHTVEESASHGGSMNPLMTAGVGAAGLAASLIGVNVLGSIIGGDASSGDASSGDASSGDGGDGTPINDPLLDQILNDPGSPNDFSM